MGKSGQVEWLHNSMNSGPTVIHLRIPSILSVLGRLNVTYIEIEFIN